MMRKKRQSYHHGHLREALIDAAFARLSEDESADLSLRAVAGDVGVTPMAVYRHFPNADGLLAALAVCGFEMLGEHLMAVKGGGKARLEAIGTAYVQFAQDHPGIYRLIFRENHFGTPVDAQLREAGLKAFGILVATVADLLPAPRKHQARDMAHTLWAGLHGAVELARVRLLPVGEVEDAERREHLLDGIRKRFRSLVK